MQKLTSDEHDTIRYFLEVALGARKAQGSMEAVAADKMYRERLESLLPALLGKSRYRGSVWHSILEVPSDCHFVWDNNGRVWVRSHGVWTNARYGSCDLEPGDEAPFYPVTDDPNPRVRIGKVLDLCEEADRKGISSGGMFTVDAVRALLEGTNE